MTNQLPPWLQHLFGNGLMSKARGEALSQGLMPSKPPTSQGLMGLSPDNLLSSIFEKYRGVDRHREVFSLLFSSDTGDGRQLEYYPPWEGRNPQPGKATVELYNTKESPEITQNLVTGDMLHYLGSINPFTGTPVDPTYFKLKQQLLQSRTPEQRRIDERAYQHDLPYYENPPTTEDWMQDNRGDAYMRGYLTPDAQDNWRDMYTPEQRALLEHARRYLTNGTLVPHVVKKP